MKTITLSATGRLTLPTEVRRALGIEGETELEVEVDTQSEEIVMRPALVLRREDAWAYTPEHRQLLSRSHADSRKGKVRRMSEHELKTLGD